MTDNLFSSLPFSSRPDTISGNEVERFWSGIMVEVVDVSGMTTAEVDDLVHAKGAIDLVGEDGRVDCRIYVGQCPVDPLPAHIDAAAMAEAAALFAPVGIDYGLGNYVTKDRPPAREKVLVLGIED